MAEGALVLYGRGGSLGNFKFFADDLVKQELSKKYSGEIKSVYTDRRAAFFKEIEDCSFEIKELHVFTHSIGGGLFLSYQDAGIAATRNALFQSAQVAGTPLTYEQVVANEVGAILGDNFLLPPLPGKRADLRKKFASGATIKIWGCNSGIVGWVYSDSAGTFYWQALNLKNTPKPAVAQAFADFFDVETIGARSGANIQVKYQGKWIYADKYKKLTGRFAGEPQVLRFNPTRGGWHTFTPRVAP